VRLGEAQMLEEGPTLAGEISAVTSTQEENTPAWILMQGEQLRSAVVAILAEVQILEEELKPAAEISAEASTQEENIPAVG